MCPRPTKKWGFELPKECPPEPLPQATASKLIALVVDATGRSLGTIDQSVLVEAVQEAVARYRWRLAVEKDGPTRKAALAALRTISKAAKRFAELSERLDEPSRNALLRRMPPDIWAAFRCKPAPGARDPLALLAVRLNEIATTIADLEAGKMPKVTAAGMGSLPLYLLGAPDPFANGGDAFGGFVRDLLRAFAQAAGSLDAATVYWSEYADDALGGYQGRVLPFVRACAALVGEGQRRALGDTVKRVRKRLLKRQAEIDAMLDDAERTAPGQGPGGTPTRT